VTVTLGVTQTPFLAGTDPFDRFPRAGETSASATTAGRPSPDAGPPRAVIAAMAAVTAALTPTASSQPSLAVVVRGLVERFQLTRATFQDVLPLLGFGPMPLDTADPAALAPVPRGNAARALAATADLSAWLGMTEEQIADIAGFSRRNYSNWRSGLGSYPKTVRALFEIHALVGGLVRSLGRDGAVSWVALPSALGGLRRQLLATSTGRAQLLAEAQPLLFAMVERERPAADFEETMADVASQAQRHVADAISKTPPLRRRRLG
jgi:transcriptional regulator with XRE-family HTH domain